jgi:hypothetical protein
MKNNYQKLKIILNKNLKFNKMKLKWLKKLKAIFNFKNLMIKN